MQHKGNYRERKTPVTEKNKYLFITYFLQNRFKGYFVVFAVAYLALNATVIRIIDKSSI